ncbi:hypothetical protein GCM10010112_87140 [Actinoplanes lobatus]|uniref:PhiE125 gp8 family phage protein n=1 Tax=Actinoplanes lobatus TaxID=113568 RepID=A0A7W7MEZ9_9ACTN|nr:phage gp6-like head-tail connector protein [Actinoplanes lobatus]MBB4747751.1 hypothetical protein [Actinoplanes lobatus]GGN96150.1 hypothetical protein GCM10010112_87140 [Actinoplanes lobatus]GIE45178.1 hypothetical protein Alo02nite_80760 [Actinoplanes lobatus]
MADPVLYYPLQLLKLGMSAGPDTGREALLVNALESASRAVETYCGNRIFYRSALTALSLRVRGRVVECDDGDELLVPDLAAPPTLVEIRTGRGGEWKPVTAYDVEPGDALIFDRPARLLLAGPAAWGFDRVRITAEWGWPAVPADIREATKLLATRLYLRKDSPDGTAGVGEWGPVRVAASDPDVRALLEPFRLESAG